MNETGSLEPERRDDGAARLASPPRNVELTAPAIQPCGAKEEDRQAGTSLNALRFFDGRVIQLPAVMGVLNVTPDSFSDAGRYLDPERAVAHAFEMAAAGASIIDIGAESTRPSGAVEVSADVELARLWPVLHRLVGKFKPLLSVDTRKPEVARVALDMGVSIINDVSALADPEMAVLAAQRHCFVVLMHMKGGPTNHIRFASYHNVVDEVVAFLADRAIAAERAGIERSRIILDPGLGFAKTAQHNLAILANLERFCGLGYPLLIGASRKKFIRNVAGESDAQILLGTNAVNAVAVAAGAAIIRVHDAAPAAVTAKMAAAIAAARRI